MEVVVGPVEASSVRAFVSFARGILSGAEGPGAAVPSDAARDYAEYLAQWEALAEADGEVTWQAETDPEVMEYLVYAFYRLAKDLLDEADQPRIIPDEAVAFYVLLVGAVLDALAEVGGAQEQFATQLRELWPSEMEIP
jgi:hypothetical protein